MKITVPAKWKEVADRWEAQGVELTVIGRRREVRKHKIYIFPELPESMGGCICIAVSEDGEDLAYHVSSSIEFCKFDMGLIQHSKGPAVHKHNLYAKKYPDGYELEWVPDWTKHPFLSGLHKEKSKAASGKKLQG